MKYYIVVGEASGDMHGANLIKSIKKQDSKAEFRFWGGDKMVAASSLDSLVVHYKESSIMGFIEVLMHLRKILRFLRLCKRDIAAWVPDIVIFIDYPGFNFKIAKWAHNHHFTTCYYIAPKVWAWKKGRVRLLKKYIDKLLVIFPFEVEWFAAHGAKAIYVGNPLLDEIAEREVAPKPEKPVIALVAGSREMEVEHNLATMVAVSRNFPDYQFVVTGVDWLDRSIYDKHLAGSTVQVVFGKTYQIMELASAALVTSGTATLEAAILNVPEVVCYRGPSIMLWIAHRMVKIKWISLVNLIMDRTVVREMIGNSDFSVERASSELAAILPGGSKHDQMLADFEELRQKLGAVGASDKAAQVIVDMKRLK